MAYTNREAAAALQAEFPRTYDSLQTLVMAMAKFANHRGKKSLFGKDKGIAAYSSFETSLRNTLRAMVLDGIIEEGTAPRHARIKLIDAIEQFAFAYPNWEEAYAFGNEFFLESAATAEDRIQNAMSR